MNISESQASSELTSAPKTDKPKARKNSETRGRLLRRALGSGLLTVVVIALALIWSVPTFGLFVSSFRPASLITTTGWWSGLIPPWNFTLQNYIDVLQAQGLGQAFVNSLIISIPGTFLPMIIAAFGAYAFAWMKFPGRDFFFMGIVALLVIPTQIALVPVLKLFTDIGLTGEYAAVWLAHTAFGLPFAVFLLRNFFAALPSDLMESAHIDGASHWRIFWSIIIPLSVPSLASLGIFQFMWVWNDLLTSLIFLGGNPQRAPMTLSIANLVDSYGSNYPVLTAAAFLSMALPLVVFFALQRYFVRGILAGSVKG
ncbi:carbohydrate ABC transporter permease [Dictyobacter arantiisoli]|uniref:Sugar ABC transporter permease n=1 Tax=Dictyobacter arantiisoli TaxID=2014874 RepID=A0A5A5TES8_9CHLR|nr:carbohydrate ABC transporter permease [Dictyobacter arantiisoli]GCF09519.1 sugar ABC transporter permease [Dictyobacter arantiisoli]